MVQTLRDLFAASHKGGGKLFVLIWVLLLVLISKTCASLLFLPAAHKVTVSFLEVYNENIRDLLSEISSANENLDLREDPIKGPIVAGITEVCPYVFTNVVFLFHFLRCISLFN